MEKDMCCYDYGFISATARVPLSDESERDVHM